MANEQRSVAGTYQNWVDQDESRYTLDADRDFAARYRQVLPEIVEMAAVNRAFLAAAARTLAREGIEQFVDLGAGQIHRGAGHGTNLHEVVQAVNPRARMVYVDIDAETAHFGRVTVSGRRGVEYLHADARDPQAVFGSDEFDRCALELRRPIGLLMGAMLPFVPDQENPAALVAAYREATAPGSFLVVSHATNDYDPARMTRAERFYNESGVMPLRLKLRSRRQIERLLAGYELLDPGLVNPTEWRPFEQAGIEPGGDPKRHHLLVAVGRR